MVDLDDWKYSSDVPMSPSVVQMPEEISRALPLRVSLFTHCPPHRVALGSEGLQPLSRFGQCLLLWTCLGWFFSKKNAYWKTMHKSRRSHVVSNKTEQECMKEVKLSFPKTLHFHRGEDTEAWQQFDTLELLKRYKGPPKRLLVDQGLLLWHLKTCLADPGLSSLLDLRFGGSFSVRTTEAWTSESLV